MYSNIRWAVNVFPKYLLGVFLKSQLLNGYSNLASLRQLKMSRSLTSEPEFLQSSWDVFHVAHHPTSCSLLFWATSLVYCTLKGLIALRQKKTIFSTISLRKDKNRRQWLFLVDPCFSVIYERSRCEIKNRRIFSSASMSMIHVVGPRHCWLSSLTKEKCNKDSLRLPSQPNNNSITMEWPFLEQNYVALLFAVAA